MSDLSDLDIVGNFDVDTICTAIDIAPITDTLVEYGDALCRSAENFLQFSFAVAKADVVKDASEPIDTINVRKVGIEMPVAS